MNKSEILIQIECAVCNDHLLYSDEEPQLKLSGGVLKVRVPLCRTCNKDHDRMIKTLAKAAELINAEEKDRRNDTRYL